MNLSSLLQQRRQPNLEWQCSIYDLSLEEDAITVKSLLQSKTPPVVLDDIDQQVMDLIASREPQKTFLSKELADRKDDEIGEGSSDCYGRWVYYPWSNRLVHVLNEEDFIQLRSDRNQNKITRQEQRFLSQKKIGILGLSVGHSAAMTLALKELPGIFALLTLTISPSRT